MTNTRNLSILTDESLMPFGKFKDQKMADVPYWHLLWLNAGGEDDNSYIAHKRRTNPEVFQYIEENLDALIVERKRNMKETDTTAMFNSY